MRPDVRQTAIGRWPGILAAFGIDAAFLTGRHTACPVCGGKDRFRFDDKGGRGTFYCSHCGPGDGFTLLQNLKGWDFKTTAREVEHVAGVAQAVPIAGEQDESRKLAALRRVWTEARPLQRGDEAMRYLAARGLVIDEPPAALRLHSSLTYHGSGTALGRFACMVALVQTPEGAGATLHRTYLQGGTKAPVPAPKKLMPGKPIKGAAVRLFPLADVLGVAEGIETAIAAWLLFGVPTWSCISAAGIESFQPPAGVRKVIVFADNDISFAGQKAAMTLAHRLIASGIEAEVRTPARPGTDWADPRPHASAQM